MSSRNTIHERVQQINTSKTLACLKPWTSLEEMTVYGHYKVCCWQKNLIGFRGKKSTKPFSEIWHGGEIQQLRQGFVEDDYLQFCPSDCVYLFLKRHVPDSQDLYPYDHDEYNGFGSEFKDNRLKVVDSIEEKRLSPETRPLRLRIYPSNTCNLNCRMCNINKRVRVKIGENYQRGIREMLPYLEELAMYGGEPFACTFTRDFIFGEQLKSYPQVHFSTVTNGTLLDGATRERLKPLRLGWFLISLDSCQQETYESIRKNARFDRTMSNLLGLIRMRDQGMIRIRDIRLAFVIQKANYQEIEGFIQFANDLKVKTVFTLISGFTELLDCLDELEDSISRGIARSELLNDQESRLSLMNIKSHLSEYENSMRRQKSIQKVIDILGRQRAATLLEKRTYLKYFLKRKLHI